MDYPTSMSETDRKLENGNFVDNLGNYTGILSVTFFFVTILQVLAIIWETLKGTAKSNKSATVRKEVDNQQAEEATRIYQALEKLAKVSISNHL